MARWACNQNAHRDLDVWVKVRRLAASYLLCIQLSSQSVAVAVLCNLCVSVSNPPALVVETTLAFAHRVATILRLKSRRHRVLRRFTERQVKVKR